MDQKASQTQFYNPAKEEASRVEIGSQELGRDGEKAKEKRDGRAFRGRDLPITGAVKAQDETTAVDADGTLVEVLRTSELSDEEEVVDVSPNGCTLSSLEFAKQELAAKVKSMFVYDNTFPILPVSIQNYKNLRKLKFFSNEVRTLPQELGDLTKLEHLHLKVSPAGLGSLPPLGKLRSLKALELHQVPSRPSASSLSREIAQLHSLTRLAVCHFSISWVPAEIGTLKNLEELDLSFNKLKTLPKELAGLVALKCLKVASNKLVELPPELTNLPSLKSIDVSHNRLTSLSPLQLFSMTSLRVLNAQFNKLQHIDNIPKWIRCNQEGNESLQPEGDFEVPDGNRLNSSRKHRSEDHGEVDDAPVTESNSDPERKGSGRKDQFTEKISRGNPEREPASLRAGNKQMESQPAYSPGHLNGGVSVTRVRHGGQSEVAAPPKDVQVDDGHEVGSSAETDFQSDASTVSIQEETFGVDRSKQEVQEVSLEDYQEDDSKEASSESLNSCVTVAGVKAPRRQDSDRDRNPKPSKRRRSVKEFSEVSFKYCIESFVGFDDRLHDGFYDAGRDRPFLSLEVLEKEQLCFDSREVILVDREKDEELDVIALSAQQLLAGLESSRDGDQKVNVYQRIATLALFVSDCFGGSDKTHSISNMRRSALGGTAGMPFVCSCSSSSTGIPISKAIDKPTSGAVLPSVHMLCEGAVRFLKAQQGSNILPIGSFPYGVCRHRAILFKYLCDRADPVIPCELVRGYLDYMPHAWNVVLVGNANESARMLVDACRPLDIRQEQDPEYFCRYIPFKRIKLPLTANGGQKVTDSTVSTPLLHEDIGRGASGAIVQRCTFGTFTAAAKVRQIEAIAEGRGGSGKNFENSFLSELRMLCSLQHHPCIVGFYGHQLSSGFTSSADSTEVPPQSPQLIIFMEYVRGGSLEGFLHGLAKKGKSYVPPKLALHVARNVACALSLLHSKSIIHRDVKSSNVLIDLEVMEESDASTAVVKLCDFDSAVPLQSSSAHTCYLAHRGVPAADVCVGTPRWIAPEVLRAMYGRHSYGLEADLWSFGCLLVELLTLKVPYDGLIEQEVHSCIQIGQRPHLSPELDKLRSSSSGLNDSATRSADDIEILSTLVRLFYSCTDPCPSKRPSAKEVFSALSSTVVGRACTTSPLDEQIIQETTAGLDVSKRVFIPKREGEALSSSEKSCLVCNRPKNSCSCGGRINSDTNNSVDPSEYTLDPDPSESGSSKEA